MTVVLWLAAAAYGIGIVGRLAMRRGERGFALACFIFASALLACMIAVEITA